MEFQFLIKDARCFQQADVWYIEGELLSGNLSKDTRAIAMADGRELSVFIRNVAFVDPPAERHRFFTLTIDKPGYEIGWLKGARLIARRDESERQSGSLPDAIPDEFRHDIAAD